MSSPVVDPEFDQYAAEYDRALSEGLSVSGEDKNYFAAGRVAWLARCLARQGVGPSQVLDFGCGTGSATPFLLTLPGVELVTGVDVSARSLEVARRVHGSERAQFLEFERCGAEGRMDLVFCNGVFHHIPLAQRAGCLEYVFKSLKVGGLFALWENNPWNPGTRYVMSRIPFDREAITLSALESKRLARAAGFEVVRIDFLFLFPHMLRWFRWIEPIVMRLPLGAQYQVLCRKTMTKPVGGSLIA